MSYQADWLEDVLDKHAEYYIGQTMKFFQENGESPALSKNNLGDLAAKAAITTKIAEARIEELEWLLDPAHVHISTSERLKQLKAQKRKP